MKNATNFRISRVWLHRLLLQVVPQWVQRNATGYAPRGDVEADSSLIGFNASKMYMSSRITSIIAKKDNVFKHGKSFTIRCYGNAAVSKARFGEQELIGCLHTMSPTVFCGGTFHDMSWKNPPYWIILPRVQTYQFLLRVVMSDKIWLASSMKYAYDTTCKNRVVVARKAFYWFMAHVYIYYLECRLLCTTWKVKACRTFLRQ